MRKFTLEGYEKYKERKGKVEVVPTSIPSLNDLIGGGLRTRNFYVLLASTGVGKTTTMMGFMLDVLESGKKVAFLSIDEEDQYEVAERVSCMHNRVRYEQLVDGSISDEDFEKVDHFITHELAENAEIYFSRDPFVYRSEIIEEAGKPKTVTYREIDVILSNMKENDIKYLFIDYLGAIITEEQSKMYSRLAEYSSELKTYASEHNCMIFTSMQANRELKKAMKQPDFDVTLVDESFMADSIGPARKATVCLSLIKQKGERNTATLNVFKNRLNGQNGHIKITIDPLSLRWDEFYDFEA